MDRGGRSREGSLAHMGIGRGRGELFRVGVGRVGLVRGTV